MTAAAIRLSRRVNGVSARHGRVSRRIWRGLWEDRAAGEVPIRHVTNGVHLATWMSEDVAGLLDEWLPAGWRRRVGDEAMWRAVRDVPAQALWRVRRQLKLRLNLPRVPLEASGTSGMKAALNGVPQLATADGWWEEGFEGDNGWIIPPAPAKASEEEEDEHDHGHLFRLLEEDVIPLYYDRSGAGSGDDVPAGWLAHARRAIEVAGARFTAGRMVREYARDYYAPSLRGDT